MVSRGFLCWVGGGRCKKEGQRGNASVPDSSFSPQENSDVFLSTVDTDWKVGSAMGGAPRPWVLPGTAAWGWGRLRGAEWTQECCCPPRFHGVAVPGWCLCMGLHVHCGPWQEGTGEGHAARHALCWHLDVAGGHLATGQGQNLFKTGNFFSGGLSCFSSPSAIAMAMVSRAMPAPCLHKDV